MTGDDQSEVRLAIEQVFRQEAGKIVSSLTRVFGLRNLQLVEDSLQEALLKALTQWSYGHMPRSPLAWLMHVARNEVLDVIRRDTRLREKEGEIIFALERDVSEEELHLSMEKITDDQLRM